MTSNSPPSQENPIVIFGAGAIGCYLGAHWVNAGAPIVLLGRPALDRFAKTGLSVAPDLRLPAASFATNPRLSSDPTLLAQAGMIVLTLKTTTLPNAIKDIAAHARPQTPIIPLLNGLSAARDLRCAFPEQDIVEGMVPFNVVWKNQDSLRRSSLGQVTLADAKAAKQLAALTKSSREPVTIAQDIKSVQHGKLLLNLINPVNALSGLSLYNQLKQRPFRRVYAAALSEAIHILDKAQIPHAKSGPLPAKVIAKTLLLPDVLFNTLALKIQKLDPTSQTSMASDLIAGKPTEIDALNGEIVKIAAETGQMAPVNSGLVALIKQAESGGRKTYTGQDLLAALNL